MSKRYVMSLGGSLIVPGEIDTFFLRKFIAFIKTRIKKGDGFIIVTGGGRLARNYIEALKKIAKPSPAMLDWLGIFTTHLNAELVRLSFGSLAHPLVVEDPNKKVAFKGKMLIAGGWKPGRSTDDVAVRLAEAYGADAIINLSNIDYVYTKDPRKFKDAKKIERMTWKEYRKVSGSRWDPGLSLPFDPVAARSAQNYKKKVYIVNGKNIPNLNKVLDNKAFVGTMLF